MSTGKPSYSSPEFDPSWSVWTEEQMLFAFPLMEQSGAPVDLKGGTVVFGSAWAWIQDAALEWGVWLQNNNSHDVATVEFSVDIATSNTAGTILILKDQTSSVFRSGATEFRSANVALEARRASGNFRFVVGNVMDQTLGTQTPPYGPLDGAWEKVGGTWGNGETAEGESFTAYCWDGTERYIYGPENARWEPATILNAAGATAHTSPTMLGGQGAGSTNYNQSGIYLHIIGLSVKLTPAQLTSYYNDFWGWVREAGTAATVPVLKNANPKIVI